MRDGSFEWDQSPISVVKDGDGTMYVVDGHHRLAAARYAGLDQVAVRDVTEELDNGGFLGYKDMEDVISSAAQYVGNRLNRYKLR
jgi:hypothetical protein